MYNIEVFYSLSFIEITLFYVYLWFICMCILMYTYVLSFPGGTSGKEPTCKCKRRKSYVLDPWVRKIPWRRAWQPAPVFLPRKSPWIEVPEGLQSIGLHRIRN